MTITAGSFDTNTSDMVVVHRAILNALKDAPTNVARTTDEASVEAVASFYENVLEFLHVHHSGRTN